MLKLVVVQGAVEDKSYGSCSRYLGWVCSFVLACRGVLRARYILDNGYDNISSLQGRIQNCGCWIEETGL
jgi:hypothetical protein